MLCEGQSWRAMGAARENGPTLSRSGGGSHVPAVRGRKDRFHLPPTERRPMSRLESRPIAAELESGVTFGRENELREWQHVACGNRRLRNHRHDDIARRNPRLVRFRIPSKGGTFSTPAVGETVLVIAVVCCASLFIADSFGVSSPALTSPARHASVDAFDAELRPASGAKSCGPFGHCGPTPCDNITMYVSESYPSGGSIATIQFNGTYYSSGNIVCVSPSGTYSIAATTSAGYYFLQWSTTIGTLGSYTSSSTTLGSLPAIPPNSKSPWPSGVLWLIANETTLASWGGFVSEATQFTGVSALLELPGSFAWNGGTGANSVAFWIGLSQKNILWQAGVYVVMNSSTSSLWIVPFWECIGTSCPSNLGNSCSTYWYGGVCFDPSAKMTVNNDHPIVTIESTGQAISVEFQNIAHPWLPPGPASGVTTPFTAAEWVGECDSCSSSGRILNSGGAHATWNATFVNPEIYTQPISNPFFNFPSSSAFPDNASTLAVVGRYSFPVGAFTSYEYLTPYRVPAFQNQISGPPGGGSFTLTNEAPSFVY
jgi:hypothetical protein